MNPYLKHALQGASLLIIIDGFALIAGLIYGQFRREEKSFEDLEETSRTACEKMGMELLPISLFCVDPKTGEVYLPSQATEYR